MRVSISCALLAIALPALADTTTQPVPSGKVKAFKGPEGEVIAMLEVNKGTEVLVHFRKLGDDLDGTTLLYELEDATAADRGHNAYITKKRGSKTFRSYMLLQTRDGVWEFYHPKKPNTHFTIIYDEKTSDGLTISNVMTGYHP